MAVATEAAAVTNLTAPESQYTGVQRVQTSMKCVAPQLSTKAPKLRKTKEKGEEKTFKISPSVKISRVAGKDKEEVKLTLDELKTAVKVTNVSVTVTHDGDKTTEIKVGGRGFERGKGKNKTTN